MSVMQVGIVLLGAIMMVRDLQRFDSTVVNARLPLRSPFRLFAAAVNKELTGEFQGHLALEGMNKLERYMRSHFQRSLPGVVLGHGDSPAFR